MLFAGPDDRRQEQPPLVQALFRIEAITSVELKVLEIVITKGKVFDWDHDDLVESIKDIILFNVAPNETIEDYVPAVSHDSDYLDEENRVLVQDLNEKLGY